MAELGRAKLIEDAGRDFFCRIAIISSETVKHLFVPRPIFQHLRRRFNKIAGNAGAGETGVVRLYAIKMECMAWPEFMEERHDDILVRQERGPVGLRRWKIANQRDYRTLITTVVKQLAIDDAGTQQSDCNLPLSAGTYRGKTAPSARR